MQTAHRSMGCAHMQHLWGGEKLLPRKPIHPGLRRQRQGGRHRGGSGRLQVPLRRREWGAHRALIPMDSFLGCQMLTGGLLSLTLASWAPAA